MRISIISLLLFAFFSCKKESKSITKTTSTDTVTVKASLNTDTLKSNTPKEEVFNFVTELCDNKGRFDANKYTREEIEGTYALWYTLGGTLLDTPSVFDLSNLQMVRRDKDKILTKLDRDFTEKKKLIQNLKVVNVPYWQNIKKLKYEALLQQYQMEKMQISAYSDPAVLLKSNTCPDFSKALNSTDDQMVEEWRKLREEMSKRNANPQRIMNEFNNHLNSPDKRDYAIIDLITFGWGNCANDAVVNPVHDEKMSKEFESLFIKIDSDCDEP
ncbi:hypothetical protein C1631_007650 [Chryseobacterium phosphatilyticum]|uniref:Uncharacterized protein n=1 Tax=Chryseobacterium phosphatilyticum TaxID=475075 RepID=A0A316X8L5_9FLAO|nr:hypothetical protein [Chryseobacterium phosphatilyticum]PWN69884.1 hypothetical protein C1631_007650 [Chryseobacterium phosphatilyticum]